MEEESCSEVLYETIHHITRPFSSNYPPQQVDDDNGGGGSKAGFISRISFPGVNQLKEIWSEYKNPKKVKKLTSLFVSPSGEHVAVTTGNQISVLQKSDNYKKPCGLFSSENKHATFMLGAWSESHAVFGVIDDNYTLYLIKANGEQIKRISKNELKVSVPIAGLIVQGDPDGKASCLYSFIMLTSDGSLHRIEVDQKPYSRISSTLTSSNHLSSNKPFYQSVLCVDYHPEFSLLAVVGRIFDASGKSSDNADDCVLSLWHIKGNLGVDLMSCSPRLEGFYSTTQEGPLTSPKVVISPRSKHVAFLDSKGGLNVFNFNKDRSSMSIIDLSGSSFSQTENSANVKRNYLNDISNFTWWSDCVLVTANTSGTVNMIDIFTGKKLLEDDLRFSMPVLERVQQCKECVLLLESIPSEKEYSRTSFVGKEATDTQNKMMITPDRLHQLDFSRISWSLFSFLGRSVDEMYTILIANKQYEDALEFSHRHGLDKDEVFKTQWLQSSQGADDINMFLSNIKDEVFVLSECIDKVGPTEEAVKNLLEHGLKITDKYRYMGAENCEASEIWDFRTGRLQLLQFRDRLETFIGINMGRFALQEYRKFRTLPLHEAAVTLAHSGKIGALNLLFKRHPYSLAPCMLNVLSAIPETVPVESYKQLLPGRSPPPVISVRENDWVECRETINFINKLPKNQSSSGCIETECIIKMSSGLVWPSVEELSLWYKTRVRDIESYSGQLDNCICLLKCALKKGMTELQPFNDSISYLNHLIYSDDTDTELNITMNLADWEQLSDYEKFKTMLDKVKDEKVVERLRVRAIPFMLNQFPMVQHTESFLVRWLKEIASDNKLDTCLVVIEEGCRDFHVDGIFRDEIEAVECALQCVYLCTLADRWNTMSSILSKLPQIKDTDTCTGSLQKRVKAAKGHVEAGGILAKYQVPKPMSFFLEAHSDEKSVKQILRLILSKFGRRQPVRSDSDWATMWVEMQSLQEKAFPFLDLEYMLMEFSKGLLKAGRFSLARNYLKGTGTVTLATEKAENLVIQAAREYFFSASSLACMEIWKAKECLNLFPNSKNVKAEADIIDVITVKLPNLGVTLVPLQFRQIRDPMEIINMVIASQTGTYLNVDELIDVGKVLGLSSQDDIAAVREVVAREAAVSGDLQLAFDQCLVLAKMGHGSIWDLCAAIARGPVLEHVDVTSRKQLLSFALSHCDEESIGELLQAWKDIDMQNQCENLMILTGTSPPNLSIHGSSIISVPGHNVQDIVRVADSSNMVKEPGQDDFEVHFENIKKKLSAVAKASSVQNQSCWENLLRENGKLLTFAALRLPWLLELSSTAEYGKTKASVLKEVQGEHYISAKTQALVTIMSWLARNNIAPTDDLIASLARSVMEVPVTEEEDILGCSFLLNLVDAFHGVGIIEEQLKAREGYHDISSIMNIGMVYSSLHNSGIGCGTPTKRRELLLRKFQEKSTPYGSDVMDKMDEAQITFWREWKSKLEEQKLLTDQSRELKRIIPGVDTARFLSGDSTYIENVVFSLIDSVKQDKKPSLKDVLNLSDTYGLNHTKVLLRYLTSVLISEVWENDDIEAEISEHEEELVTLANEVINTISSDIYPAIDGRNKQRLSYIYNILSNCYSQSQVRHSDNQNTLSLDWPQFYSLLDQECRNLSFIKSLNFKNIAGLQWLNVELFNNEVYNHIDEYTVEALAGSVKTIVGVYTDPVSKGLITWQSVYKHHILHSLTSLVTGAREKKLDYTDPANFKIFISDLEENYDCIKVYIQCVSREDALDILKQYHTSSLPDDISSESLPDEPEWLDCLVFLLKFWIKLADDVNLEDLSIRLGILKKLIEEETVSINQCWLTVLEYVNHGLDSFDTDVSSLSRAMVVSGCQFEAVNQVYLGLGDKPVGLTNLYVDILDTALESNNRGLLHILLSTLSKSVDHYLEDLKSTRCAVWGRLTMFADNMQQKSHIRVYILEILQSITGTNLKSISSDVRPWEYWDVSDGTVSGNEASDQSVSSSRFTSTLVALKSTRLASSISSSIEITQDDLANLETAVLCFLNLSEKAETETQCKALQDILEEWEGLFVVKEEDPKEENPEVGNDWDEWDAEGWESFHEEKSPKKNVPSSIHPLHTCWTQILKKLISLSKFLNVLQIVDKKSKPDIILLDSEDGQSLIHLLVENCNFVFALKLALLLPYESIQLKCLDDFEAILKQGTSTASEEDQELFTLFLSSGAISTISTNSAYGTIFSYVCCMAGNFSRLCQEKQDDGQKFYFLFKEILLPDFLSELVKAKQSLLAGLMVSRFMHTNMSLSLVNVAEASLRQYLEGQTRKDSEELGVEKMGSCIYLENAVSGLRVVVYLKI
ncbi:hypothetical protein ACHQM5_011963 [Ranunculus cassubicifolius]